MKHSHIKLPILLSDAPSTPSLQVPYSLVVRQGGQSKTRGRITLSPDIRLADYRLDAVIDWIEFIVRLPAHNSAVNVARTANRVLSSHGARRSAHARGPQGEMGHFGDTFRVRWQEPEKKTVFAVLQGLYDTYELLEGPPDTELFGIELSLDFYVKEKGLPVAEHAVRRAQMVDVLRRHLVMKDLVWRPYDGRLKPEDHEPRSFVDWGSLKILHLQRKPGDPVSREALRIAVASDPERVNPMPVDRTFYVGAENSSVALRLMDKLTDRRDPRNDTFEVLQKDQCRPRLEATLMKEDIDEEGAAAAVGIRTAADLQYFDFASLRPILFEFWLPTLRPADKERAEPDAHELAIFRDGGIYALDLFQRDQDRKAAAPRLWRAGEKNRCLDYSELHAKIRKALEQLTREWDRRR